MTSEAPLKPLFMARYKCPPGSRFSEGCVFVRADHAREAEFEATKVVPHDATITNVFLFEEETAE